MGGQREFTAKTSTAVLKFMLTLLMRGNRSRWNTVCDEVMAIIAGYWTTEHLAQPPMATSLGTSDPAWISPSSKRPRIGFDLSWKPHQTASSWSTQGHIVLVNACGEKLFGYRRDELIGQAVEVLVPERFRGELPVHREDFNVATARGAMGGAGLELFARRKDGTEFPVEIESTLVESQEGTLVLNVIVDISARTQAQEQRREHREQIAHLSRVAIMGEMTGALAHELNQPLRYRKNF
jgi:PAS domain S-box-containing protein